MADDRMEDLAADVDEMIRSATKVKGLRFGEVLAAAYELMLVTDASAQLQAVTERLAPDAAALAARAAMLVASATARITAALTERDAEELMHLARQMFAKYINATRPHVASSSTKGAMPWA